MTKETIPSADTLLERNTKLGKNIEEQWRLLSVAIDATNNCICITDPNQPDNPIIYVNRGFERLTGYDRDEVIGRNCRFLQNDDRDQPALRELRTAIQEGYDTRVLLRNYRKDGSMFWNELYLSAVYDDQGKVIYFMGVQNDVTQRVNHEINLQKAIEQTFADSSWFTSSVMENLMRIRSGTVSAAQLEDLTSRELETLEFLAEGLKNDEIARRMNISTNTVRNYLASIYDKLGVHTRTDAAIWARERGLSKR
jgi:PAS domain S-box-containing protein